MKKYIKPIVIEVILDSTCLLAGSGPSAGFVDGETESADAKSSTTEFWNWTNEEE